VEYYIWAKGQLVILLGTLVSLNFYERSVSSFSNPREGQGHPSCLRSLAAQQTVQPVHKNTSCFGQYLLIQSKNQSNSSMIPPPTA